MKALRLWKSFLVLLACGSIGLASAKLPAPPPADPAKAAEAKQKAADGAKKAAEALAKAQDRVAERYKKEKGMAMPAAMPAAAAKAATAPAATK